MNVLMLKPFLDANFKKEATNVRTGVVPPIREHWKNIFEGLEEKHHEAGDAVEIREDFQWALYDDLGSFELYDRVYIPHKNSKQLGYVNSNARYVMQTVFPWLFTIDPLGWGGTNSNYPFNYSTGDSSTQTFEKLQKRISSNQSKFDQPPSGIWTPPDEEYILFPCQLPHDETIQFHSPMSLEFCLLATCLWMRDHNKAVVVKGHPENVESMEPLKVIASKFKNAIWVDQCSVHDAIEGAKAIYTVNSGVGMEAILHEKPVVVFGEAEYDCVTERGTLKNMGEVWRSIENMDLDAMKDRYRQFVDFFVNYCVDSKSVRIVS